MNIGTSLTIATDIDWEVLKQSIYKAYERSEGMRIRFCKDKEGNCYQYIADKEERDIELVDFSDKTEEEAAAVMRQWTCVPFKFQDSPMNRIVMIKMPEGYNGIYFLGDHRIVDAQSLICFLKDIIELYCNAKYEGSPYPKDMTSYIKQLEKDLAYEAGSKAQQRDREYFHKLIEESEPIYNGLYGRQMLEYTRQKLNDPTLRLLTMPRILWIPPLDMFPSGSGAHQRPHGVLREVPYIDDLPAAHGHPHLFPENERL